MWPDPGYRVISPVGNARLTCLCQVARRNRAGQYEAILFPASDEVAALNCFTPHNIASRRIFKMFHRTTNRSMLAANLVDLLDARNITPSGRVLDNALNVIKSNTTDISAVCAAFMFETSTKGFNSFAPSASPTLVIIPSNMAHISSNVHTRLSLCCCVIDIVVIPAPGSPPRENYALCIFYLPSSVTLFIPMITEACRDWLNSCNPLIAGH